MNFIVIYVINFPFSGFREFGEIKRIDDRCLM